MKGIFFCRGRKITKFDFYVQRQFVGLKPFVDVAKLVINKRLEFLKLLFASIILVSPANR